MFLDLLTKYVYKTVQKKSYLKYEATVSIDQLKDNQNNELIIDAKKALVFIHGWGVDSAIWQPITDQLSQYYDVHLIDLPGFGNEADISDYSLEEIAHTILPKLPLNAVWCGWSLGGLVATYIAFAFPERVAKLIQVCTSLKFVEDGEWKGVEEAVFSQFKAGVENSPQKTLNRFLSLQAMGSQTVKSDIATIKKLMHEQVIPKRSALIAGLDLLKKVDLRDQFKQLTMPCLSLFGEHDTLVPVANIQRVKKLSYSNQIVILKNSSHVPFISESEQFIQALCDFINQ
jgi:pimeloyl-[acyl-carrier protein] methyl ester esterase